VKGLALGHFLPPLVIHALAAGSVVPSVVFVLVSLGVILLGAETFTNAVEWLGIKLGVSQGAVGSVLAAVGTALPETMIPIIAILFVGGGDSHEVGIGAILGAPFLLSTAAFAITGLGVIYFQDRRRTRSEMHLDPVVIRRDLGFFFVVYLLAILSSFIEVDLVRHGVAFVLVALYAYYVIRTFAHQGETEATEEEVHPLYVHRFTGGIGRPPLALVVLQLMAALALIIAGAQVFVVNLEDISHEVGVPALALALIIAPLATELPEKFNSIIWVRQGKDTLAMGNISGAMVFQSCIPAAIGISFTSWHLDETALVSAAIALVSAGIVYLSIRQMGRLSATVLARSGLFWVGFVGYVAVKIAIS
jgi:cation:H+ antiporter